MTSATSSTEGAARESRVDDWLAVGLRGLWFVAIPALLAVVGARALVPAEAPGLTGPLAVIAKLGHASPAALWAALFVLFSSMIRYWRFHLPGWRFLSALPPALAACVTRDELPARAAAFSLHRGLETPATRRRLRRTETPGRLVEIEAASAELQSALKSDDHDRVRAGAAALGALCAPALAARRRRETASVLGLACFVAAVLGSLRAAVVAPYRVLTASMLPTLAPGDEVLGNKWGARSGAWKPPARGEVIAFRSAAVGLTDPEIPPVLLKRVIGVPGDRIQMRGGLAFINGWQVPTCDAGEYVYLLPDGQGGAVRGRLLVEFLDGSAYLTVQMVVKAFVDAYEVKPGEVFVLGDNRGNSLDSRAWNEGHGAGVPLSAIEARVDRFVVGAHLDGRSDWGRALRRITSVTPALDAEGFDLRPLREGIARCLRDAPADSRPPAPGGPLAPIVPPMQGNGA